MDKKKFAFFYDNVVKWDDSAGEEAFDSAKKQFLGKMHGYLKALFLSVPEAISLPVPWHEHSPHAVALFYSTLRTNQLCFALFRK